MKSFLKPKASKDQNENCLGSYCGYGIREELYRDENGAFFLLGTGGPSTKYAVHCCGNLIRGSKTTPLSEESARDWAKANLSSGEYDAIFPPS